MTQSQREDLEQSLDNLDSDILYLRTKREELAELLSSDAELTDEVYHAQTF